MIKLLSSFDQVTRRWLAVWLWLWQTQMRVPPTGARWMWETLQTTCMRTSLSASQVRQHSVPYYYNDYWQYTMLSSMTNYNFKLSPLSGHFNLHIHADGSWNDKWILQYESILLAQENNAVKSPYYCLITVIHISAILFNQGPIVTCRATITDLICRPQWIM